MAETSATKVQKSSSATDSATSISGVQANVAQQASANQATADDSTAVIVELRQQYVKDHLPLLALVVLAQLVLIGILGFFIFIQLVSLPEPVYFNLNQDGQIIEPAPLDKPDLTNAAMLNLVNEAVNLAFTFNYSNVKNHVNLLRPYLDDRGIKTYLQAMQDDSIMRQVIPKQLIVSAKATKAPQIIREGVFKGRYTWRVQMPLMVYYENSEAIQRQELNIDIIVWRVPEIVSPNGIKITSFRSTVRNRYEVQPTTQGKQFGIF